MVLTKCRPCGSNRVVVTNTSRAVLVRCRACGYQDRRESPAQPPPAAIVHSPVVDHLLGLTALDYLAE